MAEIKFIDKNFEEEVIKKPGVVLVDFWATWCGPCQAMLPIVSELAKGNKNEEVTIGTCNVDENPQTSGKYNIMSVPTFLIFKQGKVVSQANGMQSLDALKELIENALKLED